ncbi:multidrug efflux MFS transporter [uncultured bacterium]|uniref:MFS transporter n=1 Tax=Acetilactobacillus jinshanensis TaxID=1720083 RepID=A0A4P6ZJ22_9LACO|nr:MFS transporter [Acetilactobacillus jinshanensis]URL61811.1 multidrug efflux MFS transporter [uncultured bacterium]
MLDVSWRRNLWILWIATTIDGVAFSEVIPFLSLYVEQLGNYSKGELSILSGMVYAASFFVVFFTAPIWGRFADKHGRKRMVLQTSLGSAITLALMAFVGNAWELIGLRTLQGFFAGVIPNATALVATETPKEHAGYAMGIITTGYVGGMLVGPIIGGFLAHAVTIRVSFIITGLLLFGSFVLSATMVKEHFHPSKKNKKESLFDIHFLKDFPNPRVVIWLMISTVIVQIGLFSIYPIISLLVKQLMHNRGPITIVAGIIASLPGIAMFMTSSTLGKISDHYGANKVLILGYLFTVAFYVPQTFITSLVLLGVFRFLVGISNAAVYPIIQTMLTKVSPTGSTGLAFSMNQSAQALGAVLGSMMGSEVASYFGYSSAFMLSAILQGINLILILKFVPELRWNAHNILNSHD